MLLMLITRRTLPKTQPNLFSVTSSMTLMSPTSYWHVRWLKCLKKKNKHNYQSPFERKDSLRITTHAFICLSSECFLCARRYPGYERTKHLMAALEELTTQWRNSSHAASPLASPCLSPSNKYNPVQLPPGRFPKAAQMKEPLALPVQWQWGLDGPRGWLAQNRQEQSSAWERVGLQGGKRAGS